MFWNLSGSVFFARKCGVSWQISASARRTARKSLRLGPYWDRTGTALQRTIRVRRFMWLCCSGIGYII